MDTENILLLDGTWKLAYPVPESFPEVNTDVGWKECRVPGQWVQQGFDIPEDEPALMLCEFEFGKTYGRNAVFLRFDAVHAKTEYFLNGNRIGSSERLFLPVEFEITPWLKEGRNRLVLKMQLASNSERAATASTYAHHRLTGIPRSVRIFTLPQKHIEEIKIETGLDESYTNATLKINLKGSSSFRAGIRLRDAAGELIIDESVEVTVNNQCYVFPVNTPYLWNSETPVLYELEILKQGKQPYSFTRKVGFRKVEVEGDRIMLNGKPIILAGVNRHEIDPFDGRANTAKWARKDVALFKQANVNYVRTSHYPPTREFVEACDSAGIYLQVEAPFCWVPAEFYAPGFRDLFIDPTAAMLSYFQSHPSILLWSIGNESGSRGALADHSLPDHFHAQFDYLEAHDPTRLSCMNNEWSRDEGRGDVGIYHYQDGLKLIAADTTGRPLLRDEYAHTVAYMPVEQTLNPGIRNRWEEREMRDWQVMLATGWKGGAIWAGIDEVFHLPGDSITGYGPWGCICDEFRRIKPEFWHVKNHYSPIWIPVRELPSLVPGMKEVRIPVENRYGFTSLERFQADWEYDGRTGAFALPDILPGEKGEIILPLEIRESGKDLLLKFTGHDQILVCARAVRLGKIKQDIPLMSGPPVSHREGEILHIKGKGWKAELDARTGEFRNAGKAGYLPLMNLPGLHAAQAELGWVGIISREYKELPEKGRRKISAVVISENPESLEITYLDSGPGIEGRITWTLDATGFSRVAYNARARGITQLEEQGLRFEFPLSFSMLKWKLEEPWGCAPADHIGRPSGTSSMDTPENLPQPPDRSWSLDETKGGTADFRSTKYRVYSASLGESEGRTVGLYGEGSRHVRAQKSGDRVRFHVMVPGEMTLKTGEPIMLNGMFRLKLFNFLDKTVF